MNYFSISDKGPRTTNQDSVLAAHLGRKLILAVSDGVGGHFGGEEASKIASDVLLAEAGTSSSLESVFLDIHHKILQAQSNNAQLRGMATTTTAVVIDGMNLLGAHCGDTRCVLQRGEGIRRLTVEHTEAQRLLDAGKLTKEEFINYPRRNILDSALGSSGVPRIDSFKLSLEVGDKIVITSDGVHEKVRLREMLPIIHSAMTAEDIAVSLVAAAQSKGFDDNYSVVAAVI